MGMVLNSKHYDELTEPGIHKCGYEDMATEMMEEEGSQLESIGETADGRLTASPRPSLPPCTTDGEKVQPSLSNVCTTSSVFFHPLSDGNGNLECVGLATSIPAQGLPFCRICCNSSDSLNNVELGSCGRLIAPCLCDGSLKYVHEKCVQRWIEVSRSRRCEVCHFVYETHECKKPLKEWRDLLSLICFVTANLFYRVFGTWMGCAFIVVLTMASIFGSICNWLYWLIPPVVCYGVACVVLIVYDQVDCWRRLNCVRVVQEPSAERIAKWRMKQCLSGGQFCIVQEEETEKEDTFTAMP
ncbi:E3 ubiquitin-protein ligase MARCHF8 [Taenia crassiceps]|uniref:E3 ubiquitin-protein ligase MARCHF8 n=1 Tax=Taenia crassiceps TaxID=6207 RepID=A0ABR4QAS8_9CEST